jgi:DNA repair photolyase
MKVTEVQARSILTPQKLGSLAGAYDFSLNPYAGCAFSCSYCYVPKFPSARSGEQAWGSWVEVKVNAPELIRKERARIFGSRIFFSSATDPYQYLELRYRLSRRCLQELLCYSPKKLTLHTRSHLVLEDLDLLKKFQDKLSVGISFTTDNEVVRREFEPKAPSISRRLQLLKTLSSNGIKVFASVSPLLPCDPDNLFRLIRPYTSSLWVDQMRYLDIMAKPELLKKYADFFDEKSYAQTTDYLASLSRG